MPQNSPCLACGYHLHYPLYQPEDQPLAALGLPKTRADALNAPRYPMDFHACAWCGHIYNIAFDYALVPYSTDSNRMFNHGSGWQAYIQQLIARLHAKYDFSNLTVVEIGCGDGHFLASMKEKIPGIRCIGFEPGIDAKKEYADGVERVSDYFVPERDVAFYKPGLIICRHVIEHLQTPRAFVADIAYWCAMHGIFPYFLAEVPRIDNAVAQARVNDYLYEHVSNFTHASFRLMFERAGFSVLEYEAAYRDEVLVALARALERSPLREQKAGTDAYRRAIATQEKNITDTLEAWRSQGRRIAFWGGTGKGSAFLNSLKLDAARFPLVIDSDYHKVGYFVPGTGQEIRAPDYLLEHAVDVIVITTQWRAQDIAEEITRRGIACEAVYIVCNQRLEPLPLKRMI